MNDNLAVTTTEGMLAGMEKELGARLQADGGTRTAAICGGWVAAQLALPPRTAKRLARPGRRGDRPTGRRAVGGSGRKVS
jgi:hypothetical protein